MGIFLMPKQDKESATIHTFASLPRPRGRKRETRVGGGEVVAQKE